MILAIQGFVVAKLIHKCVIGPIITPAAAVKDLIIGDKCLHPLQRQWGSRVSGILFVNALFIRYCRYKTQALVKRTALLREEVDRPASEPTEIDREIRRAVKP